MAMGKERADLQLAPVSYLAAIVRLHILVCIILVAHLQSKVCIQVSVGLTSGQGLTECQLCFPEERALAPAAGASLHPAGAGRVGEPLNRTQLLKDGPSLT